MSIIADTLKRLQAQSRQGSSESPEIPHTRQTFPKGEGSGHHRRASQVTFWVMTGGITLALGGLAIGAFWIGWHMDFGLAPQTQASLNTRLSLPDMDSPPQEPMPVDLSSENLVAQELDPVTVPQTSEMTDVALSSASPQEDRKASVPDVPTTPDASETVMPVTKAQDQNTAPIEPQAIDTEREADSTQVENSLAQELDPVTVPQTSEMTDVALSSASPQKDHEASAPDMPTTPDTPETAMAINTEQEDASIPVESEAQEFSTATTTPTPKISQTISPSFPTTPDNMDDSDSADPLTIPLDEEEIVQPDELVMTSMLTKDSTTTGEKSRVPARVEEKQLTLSTPPQQPLSSAQRLHNARQLIQIGQYQDASVLLRPLFQEPPVNWQPWFWMGTALLGKGDIEEADQFFLSGLARNDKVPQLWIQRALVAQQRGNYQLAIHELRQAELLKPDLPHIHLNMGYAYEQLGNSRLANQYYATFLRASEGDPEYFSTRKKLFARLSQHTTESPFSPHTTQEH